MSSSRKLATRSLRDSLLVQVVERHGPQLDCVDVAYQEPLSVRELVLERSGPDGPTPAEVRAALVELVDLGYLRAPLNHGDDPDLLLPNARVALRVRGIVAARELEPGCGVSSRVVKLVMRSTRTKRGKDASLFSARLESGNREQDRMLNRGGLTLAVFYALAVSLPTRKRPFYPGEWRTSLLRLASHGVGPTSGPGDRLDASRDAVTQAVERLRCIVPLCPVFSEEDKRLAGWFLAAPFPEIRVEEARGGQFRDWASMQFALSQLMQGRPFVDRVGSHIAGVLMPSATAEPGGWSAGSSGLSS